MNVLFAIVFGFGVFSSAPRINLLKQSGDIPLTPTLSIVVQISERIEPLPPAVPASLAEDGLLNLL